ncbi:hypothetical protein [Parvibaculum sp. MBR-TMA-1.3b-4.2]|jgi:hypothetical protein
MMDAFKRFAAHAATHVAFAFLAMGGWAVYANWAHGPGAAFLAGVVQGSLSGTITYFLKTGLDRLRIRFAGFTAIWAPPAIACSISASVLIAIHAIAGTPEILATIAIPLTVATSYAVVYNFLRTRSAAPA